MDDTQRLVIALEARLTKYEKDMARAGKATNDNFKRMEGRAKQFSGNMEKMTGKAAQSVADNMQSMFAPFLRGGVIFAGVTGAAMAMGKIADSVAEVDREARKAGVSARVWQQWHAVATATGMQIDGMTDALKELNIRGDEFARTGKGSAQDAFERLGYTVADVAAKLQDPSRFLDEIIAKLQKLDRAAQTRILDEIFGGTGAEQLAKVLGMSVDEIQKLRDEAATFTEEQIEAAKKIDREFDTLWRNVTIYAKQAAIEGVGYAQKIISALRGEWLPGYDKQEQMLAYYSSDEFKLKRLQEEREAAAKRLAELESGPDFAAKELNLTFLRSKLRALDEQIQELTGGSDEYKQTLKELSGMSQRLGNNVDDTTLATQNFKIALDELKALVPELKQELDQLGKLDAVEAAFQKVAASAGSIEDVINADAIAARARSLIKFGKHDNILDLIGAAEGTDKGRGYNETLGYGAYTGGAVNLTSMTLDQVLALQKQMLAHPDNKFNSSAVGRYQITSRTLRDMMKELGLTGDRLFDEDTQDELARALLRRRGNDPAGLRNEWEGLRQVDDATIQSAYNGTPTAAQPLAPTDAQQRAIDLAKQQTEARERLNMTVQEGLELARFEQSISGMSAQQQQVELQLFRMQQEAKRNGIALTQQELADMREKIMLTQQLGIQTQQAAQAQDRLAQAGEFFSQTLTSSLSGLLTGTTDLNSAVRNLINSLIDATLQAALLGKGPLGGLFGGGILSAIFGFADGGYTGDGGKHEPAGVVHRGEYVISKKATERIGVGNLEAMHNLALKGFSNGGYVGAAPAVRRVQVPANQQAPMQQIAISAPVTVNGSAGTPEQNADLARKMAKQMETTMRGVVADEMRRQTRPGNFANQRGR